ncbi:hypothetical protein F2Q69_00042942 [Brassica cretica]|uniref:Uncharacterized protein n=1 Tax=Brassica cretica TaxID=69181 RepID=A0A8S9NRQ3_BRACR|nr:hypothetical protein F2Q69_00042942 [Brassica cretica]
MKTTHQSIDYNSQFLVDRGLDPKPDFCDPNPSSTFSSRPTSRLILNLSPLELISLHLNRTFSRTNGRGRGLFIVISNQSETSRVAARVSLRMAPDACAATPRAPHCWFHDLLTCSVTPRHLPVWMHGLAPCKETPRPPHVWPHGLVACIATPRALADPPRAPHVYLHVHVSCTGTPHAFLDTHTPRSLPPCPEHTHI